MFYRNLIRAAQLAAAVACLPAGAAEPASQDVTVPTTSGQTIVVEWTGTSPAGSSGAATNTCETGDPALEDAAIINLAVPDGTYDSLTVTAVFHIEWDDDAQDLVLSVIRDGSTLDSSDGGIPEENVVLINPQPGEFQAVTCSFLASLPTAYRGSLTLSAGEAPSSPPAGTGDAAGLAPRFQTYQPDYPNQGIGMFGGEATLDVNVNTGSIFYIGFLETLRITLDDSTSPAGQLWENKSGTLNSLTTSDPIKVADRDTGRVFAQQLIVGEGNSLSEYTDDDGETWLPGGGGGIRSGADHQSLAVGPYPPGSTIPHPTYPNAVYYCSQDVAAAFCSRSDDGGVTFGPGVAIYDLVTGCQGLHGHVKVAPDGTVYVPNPGCPTALLFPEDAQPAVIVSEDAGVSWEIRVITTAPPGSGGHGSDPSVAIADDGTVYVMYMDARDNHPHIAVSRDRGLTWDSDTDIGALAGITAAEFPAAVAGDPNRGGAAFFGTTYNGEGDPNGENFEGLWNLYFASTFDGGLTWHVTDVTPGDPVQKGGLCSGGFCRNLLDFFDAVIDPEGRVLISYEDGCIGGCPLGLSGSFTDQAIIARQSGGPRMIATFDPVEPAAPGAPRIEGWRDDTQAFITWPEPDGGGAGVDSYSVYRGTVSGGTTLLTSVGNKRAFVDTGLDPDLTYFYQVSAGNGQGQSTKGNELALDVGTNVPDYASGCSLPGRLMAIDRTQEPEAAEPNRDVSAVYVAEPPNDSEFGANKIIFTVQTVAPTGDANGARVRIFFYNLATGKFQRLDQAGGISHLDQDPNTGVHDTVFSDGQIDEVRFNADGTINYIVDKAQLGVSTGDLLSQVWVETLTTGAASNITTEEAGYFDYQLIGNEFCVDGVIDPPEVDPPQASADGESKYGALAPLLLAVLALGAALRRRRDVL